MLLTYMYEQILNFAFHYFKLTVINEMRDLKSKLQLQRRKNIIKNYYKKKLLLANIYD